MYSTIANNTFSYFLTLNEFRDKIKREHPEIEPSWIKLTTITMISQFKRNINIEFLKKFFTEYDLKLSKVGRKQRKFVWKMKHTTFYNQISLVYEDHHSTKSIKVFPNGSIQVAGCADLFDCKRVIKQLSYMFSTILGKEYIIPEDTFRVVMINSNFSLNKNLNLIQTARKFEDIFKMSFDRYGWSEKLFEVTEFNLLAILNVGVLLIQTTLFYIEVKQQSTSDMHRRSLTSSRKSNNPPHRQSLRTQRSYLEWNLVSCSTNSATFHFNPRL